MTILQNTNLCNRNWGIADHGKYCGTRCLPLCQRCALEQYCNMAERCGFSSEIIMMAVGMFASASLTHPSLPQQYIQWLNISRTKLQLHVEHNTHCIIVQCCPGRIAYYTTLNRGERRHIVTETLQIEHFDIWPTWSSRWEMLVCGVNWGRWLPSN